MYTHQPLESGALCSKLCLCLKDLALLQALQHEPGTSITSAGALATLSGKWSDITCIWLFPCWSGSELTASKVEGF